VLSKGICFLGTQTPWSHLEYANYSVEIEKPTLAEQQDAWARMLEEEEASISTRLAGQFDLSLTAIQQIAQSALDEEVVAQSPLQDRLWDACRVSVHPQLDTLAQRLRPRATWDDIVLPEEEFRLLQQIVDQKVYEQWGFARKMHRGLGISALFVGASGTGKTMAAEVLANALRLNLYRIDLSAVVSKYIGETEKNLRRLFDAAESGGTMLFFDEADALFGKRSEVKESHDRFANIEINYLLQRMESYKGLAILATNMKSALDHAFMRRLRFIINFPFPGVTERKQMWQKVFPQDTPFLGTR
jgi:ATP-dependent 26S proteasome regulatory subunit